MNTRTTSPSGLAVGITVTAAVILIIGGICQAMQGLTGIVTNEFFVRTEEWLFKLDVTTWGWIHLLLGVIAVIAGIGLFWGKVWARTFAVIVAVVSTVANFAWLPWYPLWSSVIIAFNMYAIWALTAHGRDINRVS